MTEEEKKAELESIKERLESPEPTESYKGIPCFLSLEEGLREAYELGEKAGRSEKKDSEKGGTN